MDVLTAATRDGSGREGPWPGVPVGCLVVDSLRRRVARPDGSVRDLLGMETSMRILEILLRTRGEPIPHRSLFEAAWGETYRGKCHDARLHFHVGRLRKLLGESARSPGLIRRSPAGYRADPAWPCKWQAREWAPPVMTPAAHAGEVLREALSRGLPLTVRDCSRWLAISRTAAYRHLANLVRSGAAARVGSGRAARYVGAAVK